MRGIPTTPFLRVVRITKAFGSDLFDAAGLTDSADIWAQPANSILLGVKVTLDAQFVAGSMTDLDLTMGLAGDTDGLLAPGAHNFTSDAVGTEKVTRGAYWDATAGTLLKEAAETWRAYATAVGANLSTLTAGQVTFTFVYLEL